MESPYRPPREVDAVEEVPEAEPGGFRFAPDEQRVVGRLAKYLADIGGLLIFLAVLSVFALLMSGAAVVAGNFNWSLLLQFVSNLANVVFLFVIGQTMRRAARPLKAVAQSPADHLGLVFTSLASLGRLYAVEIAFVVLGILANLAAAVSLLNSPSIP